MKKGVSWLMLAALAGALRAETPARDAFLYDVLDALHAANWASQDQPANTETRSILSAYLDQNRRYDEAYAAMLKYAHDGDALHEAVGNRIAAGALGLINANNDLMEEILRQTQKTGGTEMPAGLLAKVADARKTAWMSIATGALYAGSALGGMAGSGDPRSRLSEAERRAVIARLDALFSDELARLRAFRAGKGDPRDQTYVAYVVDKIRGYLTAAPVDGTAALPPSHP